MEAIESGKQIDKVLMQIGAKGELIGELKELLKQHKIPSQNVPIDRLNRFTRKNHQGVLAYVSPVQFYKLGDIIPEIFEKGETPLLLLLDRITDVRNFGAIIRTAECANVHAIVVPEKGAAKVGNDAIKTSAGSIYNIPICKEKNLYNTVKFLHNCGIQTVACTEKSSDNYTLVDYKIPTAIIMGSEEDGIGDGILENVNKKATIPISGTTQSLNVSVAAGIIIYEAIRQRNSG